MANLADASVEAFVKDARQEDVVKMDTGYNSATLYHISSCIVVKVHAENTNHYAVEKRIYERLGIHPAILRCCGGVPSGCILPRGLMFKYHELGSLEDYLGRKMQDPKWPKDAMAAVRYIHSMGIIHGNIAARNFLVTNDNNLILCDFAGSRIDGSACTVLPSIRYMAPSYIENVATGPTEKHDLFSLGTIFWEISSDQRFDYGRGNYMVKRIFLSREFPALKREHNIYNIAVIIDKFWKELYNNAEEASRELEYEFVVR